MQSDEAETGYTSIKLEPKDALESEQSAENEAKNPVHDPARSAFTPQPTNLVCPEPLPRTKSDEDVTEVTSGSRFHPLLHQPRRDMYGGELKKGIPKGFQHVLYDISNAVIKASNYNDPDPVSKQVFSTRFEVYAFLAEYFENRLQERNTTTGEKMSQYNITVMSYNYMYFLCNV